VWVWVNEQLGVDVHADEHKWFFNEYQNEGESDDYVSGYLQGVKQVWSEVADKL
jgi:hypothetical protein